jgi:hypothetical protein
VILICFCFCPIIFSFVSDLLDTSLGVVTNPLKDTEKDREKDRLQRRALAGEMMATSVGLQNQLQQQQLQQPSHVNLNAHVIVYADLVNERGRNVVAVKRESATHSEANTTTAPLPTVVCLDIVPHSFLFFFSMMFFFFFLDFARLIHCLESSKR